MLSPAKAKLKIGATMKSIDVMFNPTEYSISKTSRYDTSPAPGTASNVSSPATQPTYVGDESSTLSLELYFDTSLKGTDVRIKTMEVVALMEPDAKAKAPIDVTFVWGSLKFTGYIKSITQRFTMFVASGVPVRARLQVEIISKQKSSDQYEKVMEAPKLPTSSFLLKAGVQLCLIAAQELADAVKWRKIAKTNGIDNPTKLKAGTSINIPKLG